MKTARTDHEYFGELSAMAAIGQLSAEEYRELHAHLELCDACREEHAALTHFQLFELPLAHPGENNEVFAGLSAGSYEHDEWSVASHAVRAKADASTYGGMWQKACRFLGTQPLSSYASFLVLFLALSVIVVGMYQHQKLDSLRDAEVARLHNQIQDLSSRTINKPAPPVAATLAVSTKENDPNSALAHISTSVLVDKAEYGNLLARNRDLTSQLQAASDEIQVLKDQASSSGIKEDQLSARLSETESALASIKTELQAAREVHTQDTAEIRRQQEQFEQVELKLAAATNSIERDRSWLAEDRDVRNLMGARNLRIVDISDVDGKGKTRKPFGRVFFTEGKSLVFYAFDMPASRSGVQTAAYQAWGYEGSVQRGVRSLGIFYQDDQKASRWVLQSDDPDTLSEIDSVFVTVEPPGGSKKPTGNAFLTAYLKASLNHP